LASREEIELYIAAKRSSKEVIIESKEWRSESISDFKLFPIEDSRDALISDKKLGAFKAFD